MIHEAGQMIAGLQRCTRCGVVLTDYRNAMVPEGDPAPSGWAVGAFVDVAPGSPRVSILTDHPPTCEPDR
jgi:hypothetical protein